MIKAYFNYSGNRILILCSLDEKMRNICQKFAVKAQVNVDSKIYICENKTLSINPNLNLSFGEQINSKDINDKEIMVLDDRDKEFTLKFTYNGEQKEIKVNEEENFLSILSKLGTMFVDKKNKVMASDLIKIEICLVIFSLLRKLRSSCCSVKRRFCQGYCFNQ